VKLYFDRIEVGPFKAYPKTQVLDLKNMGHGFWNMQGDNLVDPGLGSNGSGKSSIWDCLSWVLFGKTIKGRPTTAVKPWDSKDAPDGKVYVEIDGRAREFHRTGITNGLWMDGKGVVQDEVERTLGFNWESFLHIVVLGQGRELFLDLTPTKKMEVLSAVMGLDKWDARIERWW
jgi:DNA repair exonuclease SbcCD ATPase subunit